MIKLAIHVHEKQGIKCPIGHVEAIICLDDWHWDFAKISIPLVGRAERRHHEHGGKGTAVAAHQGQCTSKYSPGVIQSIGRKKIGGGSG